MNFKKKTAGPKAITIETYHARQQRAKEKELTRIPESGRPPKRRGGVRARYQRRRTIIISLLKEGQQVADELGLREELRNINNLLHSCIQQLEENP